MRWQPLALIFLLTACTGALVTDATETTGAPVDVNAQVPSSDEFSKVARIVVPIAIGECRRQAPDGTNCNFLVVIDPSRRAAPNAYQSVNDQGRPVLTFTASLISAARSPDELAFILSHEAAHHIAGHLARQRQNAVSGAEAFGELATLTGGTAGDISRAQKLGAALGARSYSKEFELEADQLGTIITHRAGFDPLIGAQFFTRIADPGDQFLASHPPNAARLDLVRATAARLGAGG